MALRFIGCLAFGALAALAGCAAPHAPDTTAMGAGPACDLRIDIGNDHRCPVRRVSPDEGQQLISNGTRTHD
jgi:hypothetical protein